MEYRDFEQRLLGTIFTTDVPINPATVAFLARSQFRRPQTSCNRRRCMVCSTSRAMTKATSCTSSQTVSASPAATASRPPQGP